MKIAILSLVLFLTAGLSAQAVNTEAHLKSVPSVDYPAEAQKTGLEGAVRVTVEIDENGKVTKVNEPYGPGFVCQNVGRFDVVVMREIARKAAAKAVFVPAMKDGKPVTSQVTLKFDFKDPSPREPEKDDSVTLLRVATNEDTDKKDRVAPRTTTTLGGLAAPVGDGKVSPPNATEDTKTISGGVLNGKAVSLPKPNYPAAARAIKASGVVEVQVIIDENGTVFSAEPKSGHPLLRSSSVTAACNSRFSPTLFNGDPVKVSGIISYNFM